MTAPDPSPPGPITAHLVANQKVYGGVSLATALTGLTVAGLKHFAHLDVDAQSAMYIQALWTAVGVHFFPSIANGG